MSSSSLIRSADTTERRPRIATDRGDKSGIGRQGETGREAGRTQHAQGVVPEGDLRVQRGAQSSGGQVSEAVERVDELHLGQSQRQGIHREVPPGEVLDEVEPERHLGFARLGHVDLGPMRGDLEDVGTLAAPDRSEAGPERPDVVSPPPDEPLGLIGPGVGGEVVVAPALRRAGEQRVADGSAHEEE